MERKRVFCKVDDRELINITDFRRLRVTRDKKVQGKYRLHAWVGDKEGCIHEGTENQCNKYYDLLYQRFAADVCFVGTADEHHIDVYEQLENARRALENKERQMRQANNEIARLTNTDVEDLEAENKRLRRERDETSARLANTEHELRALQSELQRILKGEKSDDDEIV